MSVDIEAVLTASIDQFKAAMADADASVEGLSKSGSSNFSKLSSIGKGALLGIGAAVVGAGVAAVDLGMKFQSTTAQIAANANISTAAAQKIGAAFTGTAFTTIFSGQQIATAYASVAGQLGATQGHALTAAQAMQVMKAAMDLAEASGTDLNTATSALAATMQTYQVKAGGAAGASNVLFNAARMTGQGVDATSAAVDKIHTKLGALAPPLGQVGGLLVDLSHTLGSGRAAMSALSTTMTSLLKPFTAQVTAANDLKVATNDLPPSLQNLAKLYQAGALTSKQVTAATKDLSTSQQVLWTKFTAASGAVATADQAQQKMGITAVSATGQLLPLSNIIGQLHAQVAGMNSTMATAKLTADGFGASAAKLAPIVLAGANALDTDTAAVTKTNSAHAAAEKQAMTLGHQFELLKSGVEDYLTILGGHLIPITQDVVGWLMKHKIVLEALGAAFTAFIGGAIAVYLVNVGQNMVAATQRALVSLGLMEGAENTTAASTDALTAQISALEARLATLAPELDATGAAAATAGTEMEASGAAAGEAGMAGGMAAGEGAATGLTGVLGPLGLAVGVVTLGAVAIGKAISGATPAFVAQSNAAADMAANSLPQMTLKMGDLKAAQDKAAKSLHDGGIIGQAAQVAYQQLGNQIVTLQGQENNLNNNLTILSNTFGISKTQAQSVAQAIGVNLTAAMSTTQVTAFAQQIQQMGLNADTSASKMTGLGTQTLAALASIQSKLGVVFNPTAFAALGTQIDQGLAQGIISSSNLVGLAAQGLSNTALIAARHAVGASSPARKAADLVGLPFAQGVALGLSENVGLVTGAARSLMASTLAAAGGTSNPGSIGGVSPLSGLGGAAPAGGGGGQTTLALNIDGQTFARVILPALQTQASLYQRTVPLPVFGVANA